MIPLYIGTHMAGMGRLNPAPRSLREEHASPTQTSCSTVCRCRLDAEGWRRVQIILNICLADEIAIQRPNGH